MPLGASRANAGPTPLGVVLLAKDAHASMDMTLSGATIYDGDRLKTENDGTLRARLGRSQMYLGPSTAADVHGTSNGFSAELIYGTAAVSSGLGQSFQLLADGVIIRPATQRSTVVQVTRVDSHELLLTCDRAAVQVSLDNEVRTIEAGESYRMVIEPEEPSLDNAVGNPPQDRGGHPPEGPPGGPGPSPTGRNRITLILIPTVAAVVGVVVWRALVSPAAP